MVLKKLYELSNGELRMLFINAGFEGDFKAESALVRLTVLLVNRGKDPNTFMFDPESIIDEVNGNDSLELYDDEDDLQVSIIVSNSAELWGSTNDSVEAKERKPEVKDESSDVAENGKPVSEEVDVSASMLDDTLSAENASLPLFLLESALVNAFPLPLCRLSRASIGTSSWCGFSFGKVKTVCCPQPQTTLEFLNISGVENGDGGMHIIPLVITLIQKPEFWPSNIHKKCQSTRIL